MFKVIELCKVIECYFHSCCKAWYSAIWNMETEDILLAYGCNTLKTEPYKCAATIGDIFLQKKSSIS